MSFFAELRRRRVVRVAVVYAATAFAMLQAADLMLSRLGVPDWSLNLIVGLVVLGFPIALVMGWALELTPEGLRRTDQAPEAAGRAEAVPALLGKRTVFVAALLVAVGLGLSAGWVLKPGTAGFEGQSAPVVSSPRGDADGSELVVAPPTPDQNTIAVLPFVNMNANPDNVFFAEGIAEGDSELAVWATVDGLSRIYLSLSAWMPSLGWLRDSPEFYAYMRGIGSVGFWEAEGFPPGCHPVDHPGSRRLDCSGYGR